MSVQRPVTELDLAAMEADIASAKAGLARGREALLSRSSIEIAQLLGRVGARFADPADPVRQAALRELPAEAALSPQLAEVVLDGMAADWTEERIVRLLAAEFGDPGVLDGITTGRAAGEGRDTPESGEDRVQIGRAHV